MTWLDFVAMREGVTETTTYTATGAHLSLVVPIGKRIRRIPTIVLRAEMGKSRAPFAEEWDAMRRKMMVACTGDDSLNPSL